MNWLDVAKNLREGQHTKIPCCKTDKTLLVSHERTGYSCHCFRCGFHAFQPHGFRSIADIQKSKADRKFMEDASRNLKLPGDFDQRLPLEGVRWLARSGIDPYLAESYGIGWSDSLERVVLPVWHDHDRKELIAMQLRSVDPNRKPKYLNPKGPKTSDAMFFSGQVRPEQGYIVVTEDILSAIKVGRVNVAVSILGTNMTHERAYKLSQLTKEVVLWFDNDAAGKKALQSAGKLSLYGLYVSVVRSDNDPKYYSRDEIETYIRNRKLVRY